jgi:hypothetical protein
MQGHGPQMICHTLHTKHALSCYTEWGGNLGFVLRFSGGMEEGLGGEMGGGGGGGGGGG